MSTREPGATPDGAGDPLAAPFWLNIERHGDSLALIEAARGQRLTYRRLAQRVRATADLLRQPRKMLVLLRARNDIESVVWLLAALAADHAVLLISADADPVEHGTIFETFRPHVTAPASQSPSWLTETGAPSKKPRVAFDASIETAIHPDLSLVMLTSGSIGLRQAVRLSADNIAVSAHQVTDALAIGPDDCVALSLPLFHVYGFSVLASHLLAGATVVLDPPSVLAPAYWGLCRRWNVTTLPGVSFTFEALRRIGFRPSHAPTLRTMTHSGDRLSAASAGWAVALSECAPISFYKMYGMSEASSRIAVLPHHLFKATPTSVGRPVRWGSVSVAADDEIEYRGPNVMMGYARVAADLERGDVNGGRLMTGDLGHIENGNLYITGRLRRIAKIFGRRVNLDDIDRFFAQTASTATVSDDQRIATYVEGSIDPTVERRLDELARALSLPRAVFALRPVSSLPRTASGKIRFSELQGGGRGNADVTANDGENVGKGAR